jgi:hypothetical protein
MTEFAWGFFAEAAAVTYERFHAPPPPAHAVRVEPDGAEHHVGELSWTPASDAARATHGNELVATENGGYALATLVAHHLDGWKVIGRTSHGGGTDMWATRIGSDGTSEMLYIEASGVGAGTTDGPLRTRLVEKIDQLRRGDIRHPGYAIVVGFEALRVLVSVVLPAGR